MRRFPVFRPLRVLVPVGLFVSQMAMAQSEAPASDSAQLREIRQLRALLEQQGHQIEALSQQIAKLAGNLPEAKKESAPAVAAPVPAAPVELPILKAEPAPKAEDASNKHVVAKGETLTSIAKHFNIPVTELQKTNKIENDRKLQIGQTLVIPSPKTSEPEKKENP